jgi:phosphoenolpyruvate carboxykinase (ATP)
LPTKKEKLTPICHNDRYRIKVRVICSRAYHALFMWDMLIRPTDEELEVFGDPDLVIYNSGAFPANKFTKGMSSSSSVAINFKKMEMVILGTEYAGEMKKGVFTVMHYLMPKRGVLSLHSSCNVSMDGTNVALFFGLSGTGKTTLSADSRRHLVGDDEHCWTADGVFNIEGGCYAKADGLSREKEPEIFDAVRFGAVLENVVMDEDTAAVDFNNLSLTPNTRTAYPLHYIPNALSPAVCGHPTSVILLTCDAFGVLPPVARLTRAQVEYHFINGFTSKTPGTEVGVTTPQAVFSACYGEPFLVWHPGVYAKMLADRLEHHGASAYLLNTGWSGGGYGVGSRMKLSITRKILDAIHSGDLAKVQTKELPVFGFQVPVAVEGVPTEMLDPANMWADKNAYMEQLKVLGGYFMKNTEQYAKGLSADVLAAGPKGCVMAAQLPGRGAG